MTNLRLSDSKWNWILEIHCICFRGRGKQRKLSEQEREPVNNSFLSRWLWHSNLGLTGGGKHYYPFSNLNPHFVALVHITSLVQDYAKWANSASDDLSKNGIINWSSGQNKAICWLSPCDFFPASDRWRKVWCYQKYDVLNHPQY